MPRLAPVCAALGWVACLGMIGQPPAWAGVLVRCKVVERIGAPAIVVLDAGRQKGVSVNDRAVLTADGHMVSAGRVFYLESGRCAVRLAYREQSGMPADAAVIVSRTLPSVCRVALPSGVTVSAQVEAVAPGHRTAWLDQGRIAGLLLGDAMLVVRADRLIARADVIELYEDNALIRMDRLASEASVRLGDRAHLWPSPSERRTGRRRLPVLAVQSDGAAQHIWMPAGAPEELRVDRRIEVFRGGAYVATALVDQTGPAFTRATTVEACVRQPVQAGDRAELLPQTGQADPVGRIFRVDRNYCLVSAGEDAGIRRDQRLYAVRAGRVLATLTVKTVKESYCGADAQPTSDDARARPRRWDQVLSRPPEPRPVLRLGQIERLTPDGTFAAMANQTGVDLPECGTLVSIMQQDQTVAAGMIVHATSSRSILHIPACWRNQPVSTGAHVVHAQDASKPRG